MSLLIHQETFEAPALVGLRLPEAVSRVSPYKLSFLILEEVEEATLPESMILSQRPLPGQKIKKFQSIGITISKKPAPDRAPALCGCKLKDLHSSLVKIKPFYLESSYPSETCIAQSPNPGKELLSKTVITYISAGLTPFRIMPELRGSTMDEVTSFLAPYGIDVIIFPRELASHATCTQCAIQSQKPLAGSLIDLRKPPVIQVTVHH